MKYEKHTLLQIAKSMRNIITENYYQQELINLNYELERKILLKQ